MSVLIKNVKILDPNSPYNGKVVDVAIKGGKVTAINKTQKTAKVIDAKGMMLSPGWFDMRVFSGDPGYEHREDIASLTKAASFGGFTEVACLPNTNPVIQSKDIVSYIRSKSESETTRVHPIAAITRDAEGSQLTEMIDLYHAGAVAFSDGLNAVWNSDMMAKALLYLQAVDGLVINKPEDQLLNAEAQMNEGEISTKLGLKGMPALSEELILSRDLRLLEYTGGRVHFAGISSAASVAIIKEAKKTGLNVTCDVVVHNLVTSDDALESFDTNLKLNPPLRTKKDIQALWKGLEEGTIDAIVSDHLPQDEEAKKLEFDQAAFGALGLEVFFGLLNSHLQKITLSDLITKIAIRPREILGLAIPTVKEGEEANFTLFHPTEKWKFSSSDIQSKSRNTSYVDTELKGKVKAVFRGVNANYYL